MEDQREMMCQTVNYFGRFKGEFVPCVGADLAVNYIVKLTKTTISLRQVTEIYKSVVDLEDIRREWSRANIRLIQAQNKVDDVFRNQRKLQESELDKAAEDDKIN